MFMTQLFCFSLANYEKTEYSKFYKKTKYDEDICKKLR